MWDEGTGLAGALTSYERVVGRVEGKLDGPTVIVVAGIHGNEPSGLRGAERLLRCFDGGLELSRGRLVVLAGNLRALRDRSRFIHADLNRQWTPENVEHLRHAGVGAAEISAEAAEQIELLTAIDEIIRDTKGPIFFLDLHTSSAEGAPFLTIGDTLRNRQFARRFPLPVILGLEEQVDGALLEYLNNFGIITLGVEAGQHDSEDSVNRQEAVLWLTLLHAGLLEESRIPDLERCRRILALASRGVPPIVEVRHRHAITPEDHFHMHPGFVNFQPVSKGQALASDRRGLVLAPEDGRVLLPLYQGLGDDGFFIAREVQPFWLGLSSLVRRLRIDGMIHLLPGVTRDPQQRDVLIVDTRIARWYPLEIFHLFGFRKLRKVGPQLLVSRRRYDLRPPRQISSI